MTKASAQRILPDTETSGQNLVFIAEVARGHQVHDTETMTRYELATLRNIARMLAQAMADTAQSMEAQIGLISLSKSVASLTRSLGASGNANLPSGQQAKEIRQAASVVGKKMEETLQRLDGANADSGLKQKLISSMRQLKEMEPKHEQGNRIVRVVSLRATKTPLHENALRQSPVATTTTLSAKITSITPPTPMTINRAAANQPLMQTDKTSPNAASLSQVANATSRKPTTAATAPTQAQSIAIARPPASPSLAQIATPTTHAPASPPSLRQAAQDLSRPTITKPHRAITDSPLAQQPAARQTHAKITETLASEVQASPTGLATSPESKITQPEAPRLEQPRETAIQPTTATTEPASAATLAAPIAQEPPRAPQQPLEIKITQPETTRLEQPRETAIQPTTTKPASVATLAIPAAQEPPRAQQQPLESKITQPEAPRLEQPRETAIQPTTATTEPASAATLAAPVAQEPPRAPQQPLEIKITQPETTRLQLPRENAIQPTTVIREPANIAANTSRQAPPTRQFLDTTHPEIPRTERHSENFIHTTAKKTLHAHSESRANNSPVKTIEAKVKSQTSLSNTTAGNKKPPEPPKTKNLVETITSMFKRAAKTACAGCSGGKCAGCGRPVHVKASANRHFAKS